MKQSTQVTVIAVGCLALLILVFWGFPRYRVWEQGLAGEAELRRAQQNRQIAIMEAEAKQEAAKNLAQAEVERAKGVAQANKIIGDSLRESGDLYIKWLWVQGLEHAQFSTVYIPTETNLPLLEASRLQQPNPK